MHFPHRAGRAGAWGMLAAMLPVDEDLVLSMEEGDLYDVMFCREARDAAASEFAGGEA